MKKQLLTVASLILATSFLTMSAEASESKSFYVKVGGGIAMPTKKDSTIDQGGPNAFGSLAKQKLKNGNSIYAGLGYHLADNVRLELEYNHYGNIKRKFYGSNSQPEQRFKADSILLNSYYDFVNDSAFTPYLGFGLGYSQMRTDILKVDVASDYIISYPEKRKLNSLAYKLAVGANYKLNEIVSFDLGYSFAKVGKISKFSSRKRFDQSGNFLNEAMLSNPTKAKAIHAHSLTAGLRVSF
jgi:opacity protein-like surface antigen